MLLLADRRSCALASSQAARAAAMSRARSCVSQVKPSPIVLIVTRSRNFSSTVRSPVCPVALDELDDADLHAVAERAEDHAEGGRRLALALAGVDDEQALLDRLGRR